MGHFEKQNFEYMMTCIKLIDNCMHFAINTNFRDQTNNVWPQILVTMGT